ncbi:hypothetical protein AB0B66_20730 [Catellatospora sp. NPDC049111]|uniref:hypothetical protein n=1 Tax=Catellatospora sp. NPDC049111 TaxID=3155271 RepID=UPI0033EDBD2D
MLVSLYRTGPLRHRIRKGFVVAGPDRIVEAIAATPPELPRITGRRLTVQHSDRAAGVVWLDTGMLWLPDPDVRAELVRGLAEGAAVLAAAVRARGGQLLPGGWLGARGGPAWLCGDLHSVEIVSETQRELCTNLFRRYVPELIALSGRAAFSGARVDRTGSQRLADATDHLSTRYLASASREHLDRVKDSLRRDEGVSRLEHMDINPLGLPDEVANVTVRCVDAQLFMTDVLAQAMLVQAIAMQARQLERDGRRVPAMHQQLLDRNRSRAISAGLAGQFEEESGNRGERGRPARGPQSAKNTATSARERVLRLVESHVREFQAMRATPAELAPITVGLTIAGSHPLAVRNENDLLGSWARTPSTLPALDRPQQLLDDPGPLCRDHLTEANTARYPGATALAQVYWAQRLKPRPPRPKASRLDAKQAASPARQRPKHSAPPARPDRSVALFTALEQEGVSAAMATEALLAYVSDGGQPNLIPALRRVPPERAKQLRRVLRPARALTRETSSVAFTWDEGPAGEAFRLAGREGRAMLSLRVPAQSREEAAAAVRGQLVQPPPGVRLLLINDAMFRGESGEQRAVLEVVIVGMGGSS